jgi:hypothetical protein
LAENKFGVEAQSLEDAKKTLQGLSVKFDEMAKQLDARTKAIPEDVAKGVQEVRAQFEQFKTKFNQTMAESRAETQKLTDTLNERQMELRRARERGDRLSDINERQQSQLEAKMDPFQFDKPQGRVIRRTGQLVDIDIGSADNLRPGLTFSIMPADTPQRGFDVRMREVRMSDGSMARRIVPKGSIEIIEVLGANLSQARITEEEEQVRDRILTGDLLYNAIWRRGATEHIVLYGIFDLDGDGRDDIRSLKDELARMGVIVDAHFDLATMKWVGGISSQTTFAVEG